MVKKLLQEIGQPTRKEPLVWVKRLVIYKSCEQGKVREVLQDIPLERGLNIVVAQESSNIVEEGTELAGHGAGKTTFCRFLRYLLGEETFSKEDDSKAIKKLFPYGYVAGEVFVDGKLWAVARPFKESAPIFMPFAIEGCEITEAFDLKKTSDNSYSKFIEAIESNILDPSHFSGTVFRTDTQIRWEHILAWCSRDQETRYQKLGVWRNAKSQWRVDKKKRETLWLAAEEDGLFVMRCALGLFKERELEIEEKLAENFKKQEALNEQLKEAKKEPGYLKNKYTDELFMKLNISTDHELPLESETPLVPESSLKGIVSENLNSLALQVTQFESKIKKNRDVRAGYAENIVDYEIILKQAQAYKIIDLNAINELDERTIDRINKRKTLNELDKNASCSYGNVAFGKCQHISNELHKLKFGEYHDTKNKQEQKEQRQITIEKYKERINQTLKLLIETNSKIATLDAEYEKLLISKSNIKNNQDSIKGLLGQIEKYQNIFEGKAKNTTHFNLNGDLSKLSMAIDSRTSKLQELRSEHDDALSLFTKLFDTTVKHTLTQDYTGRVSFDKQRQLEFSIRHQKARTSEAIDTLSILLADISSMLYSTFNRGSMPGFIIHDSPREADLSLGVYHGMIKFVAELQSLLEEACPFQYIITTTTAPPKGVEKNIILELNASIDGKQLLKQNIAETEDVLI